ncbi:MAG: signal peptidase I, partial [candidate division KSB1 bacterium]|nr:signal peptidase I [candidate division KSB1 bacterium]
FKNERFGSEKKFLKMLGKKVVTRSLKSQLNRDEITKFTWTIVERARKKVSIVSYILTEKSLARLKGKISADLHNRLKPLKDKKFANRQDFEKALDETTGRKYGLLDKWLILLYGKIFKLSSFIITDESLQELEDIAPAEIHSQLATLKNASFFTKFSFRKRLKSLINPEQYQKYKSLIYNYSKTIYRETIESLVVAFVAAMILRMFVIQAFRIPTGSMKDTLLIGDFLLVNKFVYGVRTPDRIPLVDIHIPHFRLPVIREPKRGDIIVFKYPRDPKLDYIKRCVALPGQTVEIRNGLLYIDGKPEGEITPLPHRKKYDKEEGTIVHYFQVKLDNGKKYVIRHFDGWEHENFGPITVEPGHYFMMGDNRDNSADSRSWGSLPRDNIVGEALIIYFSWDQNLIIYPWYRIVNKIRWGRLADLIR